MNLRLLLLLALALPAATHAAGPATKPASRPVAATEVAYPINDLLGGVPDEADAKDLDGDGSPDEPTRQELTGNIIQLIESVVDRPSWRDNGGAVGIIEELDGALLVTQTPENQRVLVKLMQKLRDSRRATIQVEAAWASLPADRLQAAAKAGTLDELLDTLGQSVPRAMVLCREGQVARLTSGPPNTLVIDLAPGRPGVIGFRPIITLHQAGRYLELVPFAIRNVAGELVKSATLDVLAMLGAGESEAIQLPRPITIPLDFGGPQDFRSNTLRDIKTPGARLATSVTVPLDHWSVIGGMTLDAGAAKPDATQVYLLLRITVPKSENSVPK